MRIRELLLTLLLALSQLGVYAQVDTVQEEAQLQGVWENRTYYHFFRYRGRHVGDAYVSHRLTFSDSVLTRTLVCTNSARHDTIRVDVIRCNFRLNGDTLIMENAPLGQPQFYHPFNPFNYFNSEQKYFPYFPSATVTIHGDQLELTYDAQTTLLDAKLQLEYYAKEAYGQAAARRDSIQHAIASLGRDPRFVAMRKKFPIQTSILYRKVE